MDHNYHGVSGLGTALSNDSTNPLNKLYYVNSMIEYWIVIRQLIHHLLHLLFILITQKLELEESADLIIESGDLVPDVLDLFVS